MEDARKGSLILVSNIRHNLDGVRAQMAAAAKRAGRSPEEVRLIAVTKTRPLADVEAVLAAGVTDLGENRVQEALPKAQALAPSDASRRWHLIGSLQTNKVKQALQFADLIHSLDRMELLQELDRQAQRLDRTIDVLVQVNVSGETSKHGIAPTELRSLVEAAALCRAVRVKGLMTMAPASPNSEDARPHFAALRELALQAQAWGVPGVSMQWLSMGMSGDYTVAIEEGANLVRIGTALFGERPPI